MKPLKITSRASSPTKVILFGEHFVVYGKPAILAAIDKRIYSYVSIRNDYKIVINADGVNDSIRFDDIEGLKDKPFSSLSQPIFITIYNTLLKFDCRLGLDVSISSSVPFGSGLGTSAAVSIAIASAISDLFNKFDRYEIFNISMDAEELIHTTPSGADPAICINGGIILFRKVYEPERLIIPLEFDEDLELIIVYSGKERVAGEVIKNVKTLRDSNPQLFDRFASKSEELTLDAIQALKAKDYNTLGSLMLRNHELLKSIGVSTSLLDKLVDTAMKNGALGAKLTGAGGGGSIIILADDKSKKHLINIFKDYNPFIAKVDKHGAKIEQ